MSDGDEDSTDEPGESGGEDLPAETFDDRLDAAESDLEAAETEADLDAVEAELDAIAEDLEAAEFPEPDEENEEPEGDRLESRLSDLRDDLEAQRGPYAEDVVSEVQDARSTVADTRWTEDGERDLVGVVEAFVDEVSGILDATLPVEGEGTDSLAGVLDEVASTIEAADLDPDENAETVAALVAAADDLAAGVEDAEEWDDLSVREKLLAEGYFDVLGGKHKDFPPEWSALKEWAQRDDAEMVLLALDLLGDSGFMEDHCLDALERMGHPAAFDAMESRAQRRDKKAVTVLGKIGDDRALDTILEYVDADSDRNLQAVTLRAVGEIGSEEATQAVANKLVAEHEGVRSRAARALGMIGDPRAIEPLEVMLDEDGSQQVRASAAWALVQIGTREALEIAAGYADDESYLVEVEAKPAEDALAAAPSA
jgi:HEAT repeat protein